MPARVLDVDRRRRQSSDRRARAPGPSSIAARRRVSSSQSGRAEEDHPLEARDSAATSSTIASSRGLERRRGDQHPASRLPQRVLELVRPVRRVDVDEDHADLRRRVLDQHPLGAVRAPDAEPVARLEPERQQPAGDLVDRRVELGVGVAQPLVAARPAPRGPVAPIRCVRGWPRSSPPARARQWIRLRARW